MGEIAELFDDIAATVEQLDEVEPGYRDGAELVLRAALRNVPVGPSGRLKGSGKTTVTSDGGYVVFGSSGVAYVRPVHYGAPTSGAPPYRRQGGFSPRTLFLDQAADSNENQVVDLYESAAVDFIEAQLG